MIKLVKTKSRNKMNLCYMFVCLLVYKMELKLYFVSMILNKSNYLKQMF